MRMFRPVHPDGTARTAEVDETLPVGGHGLRARRRLARPSFAPGGSDGRSFHHLQHGRIRERRTIREEVAEKSDQLGVELGSGVEPSSAIASSWEMARWYGRSLIIAS